MINNIVELNNDIGCYLLKYIDGIDAVNFINSVDKSPQFWSIGKTLDHHFLAAITVLHTHQKILLPRVLFQDFTNESEVNDEQLTAASTHYSNFIEPSERLYIHPCFSTDGFRKLCEVYKTPFFHCYSRLLPLNTVCHSYPADFGLLDYEWYGHTIGAERTLNGHEKDLFKVSTYFDNNYRDQNYCSNVKFVRTLKEFKQNLVTRFLSNDWLEAIDFSKWVIVGGCVLNALCKSSFPNIEQQDVNLVCYVNNVLDFKKLIDITVDRLKKMFSNDLQNKIKLEQILGTPDYNVFLPCHIRLNLVWADIGNSEKPLSHILHNFDMDICQVAFTGETIVSTFPFLQALATKSFIAYSLHARSPKHLCMRIAKYCNRGFRLLEPIDFDGHFDSLMVQEEIPLYRVEHQRYINADGEVQIAKKEHRRGHLKNIDTYRLQEKFMRIVYRRLHNQ